MEIISLQNMDYLLGHSEGEAFVQKRIKRLILMGFLSMISFGFSQQIKGDQKVFLITLDGLRWQELFSGADSLLVRNEKYVKHPCKVYKQWMPFDFVVILKW